MIFKDFKFPKNLKSYFLFVFIQEYSAFKERLEFQRLIGEASDSLHDDPLVRRPLKIGLHRVHDNVPLKMWRKNL